MTLILGVVGRHAQNPLAISKVTMNQAAQKELSYKEYWDQRYLKENEQQSEKDEANYEWFKTFEKLRPFLVRHLPNVSSNPRILHLGCGTSVGDTVRHM